MKPVCAITGSSGYVGSTLARALAPVFDIVPLSRKPAPNSIPWSLDSTEDITLALTGHNVKTLVHAAWDFSHPDAKENERINVTGSANLLRCAINAGVERIVFISSISAFAGARSHYGDAKLQVECLVLKAGGTVIRPGLVWGNSPINANSGMFGSLRKQVANAKIIPLIGDGRAPQYLVHEDDLGNAVLRAAKNPPDSSLEPLITLAHPQPWPFRDLLTAIAAHDNAQPNSQPKKLTLLPIPWRLIYTGLRTAELLGLKLSFRSDSVTSFIYQNPAPDFASTQRSNLSVRPFSP